MYVQALTVDFLVRMYAVCVYELRIQITSTDYNMYSTYVHLVPESSYVIIDQAQLMPHKLKLNLFKSLIVIAA